jgi:hypothetical protein
MSLARDLEEQSKPQDAFHHLFAAVLVRAMAGSKATAEAREAHKVLTDLRKQWLSNGRMCPDGLPMLRACVTSAHRHVLPRSYVERWGCLLAQCYTSRGAWKAKRKRTSEEECMRDRLQFLGVVSAFLTPAQNRVV